jgi:hypothetical protein
MKIFHVKAFFIYVSASIIFILILNFISGILLTAKDKVQFTQIEDERVLLPVYKNIEYGKLIFREFNSLKTDYVSYVGWKRRKFAGKTIHINSDGFRYNPKQKYHRDSSAKNVFFFGGSTIPMV